MVTPSATTRRSTRDLPAALIFALVVLMVGYVAWEYVSGTVHAPAFPPPPRAAPERVLPEPDPQMLAPSPPPLSAVPVATGNIIADMASGATNAVLDTPKTAVTFAVHDQTDPNDAYDASGAAPTLEEVAQSTAALAKALHDAQEGWRSERRSGGPSRTRRASCSQASETPRTEAFKNLS